MAVRMNDMDSATQKVLLLALQELIHAEEAKNQALGKLVGVVAKLIPKDNNKLTRSST